MFFRQFAIEGLGCYSYLIGCRQAGMAFVVDPQRHVDEYLRVANENELTIVAVFDTHLHADHISGARELATRVDADILLHHAFPAAFDFRPVGHGEFFDFGAVRVDILETPGHTPNSISLAISDELRSREPLAILTGDLLFVGDVGRPDLVGDDLLTEQIKNLRISLHDRLGDYPDEIEIYPAHGAGSLCGKSISAKPMTTLGFERKYNPLLSMEEEEFAETMASGFQSRPSAYVSIVNTNAQGPALLSELPPILSLTLSQLDRVAEAGAHIIDTRSAGAFGSAFLPGAINIGANPNAARWLGLIAAPDDPVILFSQSASEATDCIRQFLRVGFDRILGYFDGGVEGWAALGNPLDHLPQLSAPNFERVLEKYPNHVALDIRTEKEWLDGHLSKAIHHPLDQLAMDIPKLDPETHITVICRSGYRANIAGSLLKANGFKHVYSLLGGMTAWENHNSDA
jgi:hydroxyacylglutathione hydrolase